MNIQIEQLSKQQLMLVNRAITQADKSPLNMRIGAVLCKSGIEITGDFNQHGSKIQDPMGINHNVCSIHAEMGICKNYYAKCQRNKISLKDIKKLTLCVVRIGGKGDLRDATPCMECTAFLKKWLPCKILYSTGEGFYYGKVSELDNDHLSYFQMKRRLPNKKK